MPTATLRTATLGCKVNQYETQFVREGLERIGYREPEDDSPADLCLVNTCTVTAEGDAKSRQTIRRLARQNPDARIVVMGCYATRAPQEVARLPGVSEVITDKRELPDWLLRMGLEEPPTGISGFANRHRAFVKVQDGCLLRCSYCIIPQVRPHLLSRPPEHVLEEARRLLDRGFREIVLTGIHLGHYGVDLNRGRRRSDWVRLASLVDRLAKLPGDFRIRLSSIEPTEVTRELLTTLAQHGGRVCPHLHICMQSGSDRILRRMKRRWGVRRFVDRCRLALDVLPSLALSTDIIVGFPGESEEDFLATCRVVEELGFAKVHAFTFSPRHGTAAAEMCDQVSATEKALRLRHLNELAESVRKRYMNSLLGRQLHVLVESPLPERQSHFVGTSCRGLAVEFPADTQDEGMLRAVRIHGVNGERLSGSQLQSADLSLPVQL